VKKKGKKKQQAKDANSQPNGQQDPALAPEAGRGAAAHADLSRQLAHTMNDLFAPSL
jgi:hypothetical protein